MKLALYLGSLGLLSVAMVVAMVRFSHALLAGESEERRRWGVVYAGLWVAIGVLLLAFVREMSAPDELERNLLVVVVAPLGWLAVHASILWFGSALGPAEPALRAKRQRRAALRHEGKKEETVADLPGSPQPPVAVRFFEFLRSALAWIVTIGVALLVIGIGENLQFLHRFDARLAPHRPDLKMALIALLIAGFGLFMGGTVSLALRQIPGAETSLRELRQRWRDGTWRDSARIKHLLVILAGVLLATGSGAAMGIVFGSPGLKLMVILVVGYVVTRTIVAFYKT